MYANNELSLGYQGFLMLSVVETISIRALLNATKGAFGNASLSRNTFIQVVKKLNIWLCVWEILKRSEISLFDRKWQCKIAFCALSDL